MNRQKTLKKNLVNITIRNKMTDNNNIMKFKNFEGQTNFQAVIDPFTKSTKNEIEDMIKSSKSTKNYFFEWTTYQSKIKPFYDIDMFYDNKEDQEKNINIIEKETLEVLKTLYPESGIAISSSHGAKTKIKNKTIYKKEKVNGKKVKDCVKTIKIDGFAISFHFVVCDYETTVEELRKFNEKHNLYDLAFKNTNEKMFDKGVYRDGGNMRFLYSYKPNDDRQKIPVNYKDDYMLTKHVIQSSDATNYFKRPMPTGVSPPASPPQSPKAKGVVEEVKEEEFIIDQPIKRQYDAGELQDILDMLPEECYEYDDWIKIGMAICNVCEGDNIGAGLYIDWSKKDEDNYDLDLINKNWRRWKKRTGNKLGMTFLRKLKNKYQPKSTQSLQQVFRNCLIDVEYGKGLQNARKCMYNEMNNRVIFVKETGDYIILDKKIIRKDNEELITMPCWFLKTATKTKDHFLKEKFSFTYKDADPEDEMEDGKEPPKKTIHFDPFKEWCEWIDRKEVRAIGFDPREKSNSDLFNLWNGFNVSKEEADKYDEKDAEPILNVIKDIWCKGDEDSYNYVLDYFSHIIQKPHIKTGVLLALKSKQGGMKGIILDKLAKIIGDAHYAQNSNANFLFGDFNGQLEGKILVNLDEAFWGGDKKLEGVVKNKITETRQTINKKNKENYMIDDYANYIITTNNDWFAGTTEDDRRHYCLELDNRMAGRMTPEKLAYIQPVLDAPCEAFAKILYNRDISEFKPRMFKKTKLLQTQVEMNWNSPKVFWNRVMKDGGFEYNGHFIEWNNSLVVNTEYEKKSYGLEIKNKKKEKRVVYSKDWLFKCYEKQSYNGRKFDNSSFWREIEKKDGCLGDLYVDKRIQIKKQRKIFVFLPTLEEARQKWNEIQEYDYDYGNEDEEDEWAVDDGYDMSSDDE
jgi:hypothetical protein